MGMQVVIPFAGGQIPTGLELDVVLRQQVRSRGQRWLAVSDSVLLSTQRKLAAVALGSLLAQEAQLLPLLDEVLSYCVGVLSELEPPRRGRLRERSP